MPTRLRPALSLLSGLATLSLLACSPAANMSRNPEMPYPLPREPQVGEILHLPTGVLVEEKVMLDVATDARIVYVGETHDNPASHRLELTVLQAMADRHAGRVALGMEMFTSAQQEALDLWTAGDLSEKEFLRKSRWYGTWSSDFDYYRPLLEFARERKIPVVGLNAPKSLVKALGQAPPADLSTEQQALLPQMDMEDPYQKEQTAAIFGGHGAGNAQLEGFLRVQTLWDETMAQNVAAYLSLSKDPEMRMVVVAGSNHVAYGFGIPRRVFRRFPTSYCLVGSREIVVPEEKKDRIMDVDIPQFPMPPYDFQVFTVYEDLGKQEVRLGVLLEEDADGVKVKGVLPGSAAEAGGIREGDRILSLDGENLQENFDLVYAIKQKKPGDGGTLEVERNGEKLTVEVIFAPNEQGGHGKPAKP